MQILPADTLKVCGKDMQEMHSLSDAYLLIDGNKIAAFGSMKDLNRETLSISQEIDAEGRMVFPSFCDSHTHIVYAGSREIEYIDKIRGLSYEEIARRGGGILNSCKRLREASEEELFEGAWNRLEEMKSFGTGAVEIKSGYGLDLESDLQRGARRAVQTVYNNRFTG